MGEIVISSPCEGEVWSVGKVGENDPRNHPHHHLPSRREVGGVEVRGAPSGEVRKDDLFAGLGAEPVALPPSRALAREGLGKSGNAGATPGHVIGIDPGVNGAIALLTAEGALVDVLDMPTLADGTGGKRSINAPLLAAQIRMWAPALAYCEFVAARPGEGPVGAFSFGRCRGVIEGTLGAIGIPVQMLAPAWWKRRAGIAPGADRKDEARSKAIAKWPEKAALFARKRDDGRAEACLIATAGLMRESAGR